MATIPNNSSAVTLFLVFKICDVFASNYRNQFVINVFTIFSWPFTAFRPFTSSFTRLTRFTIIALPSAVHCKATLNTLHWVQTFSEKSYPGFHRKRTSGARVAKNWLCGADDLRTKSAVLRVPVVNEWFPFHQQKKECLMPDRWWIFTGSHNLWTVDTK